MCPCPSRLAATTHCYEDPRLRIPPGTRCENSRTGSMVRGRPVALSRESQRFRSKESRERSKISVTCFAMMPRPMPFLTDDPKPATWSVETRLR